MNYNSFLGQEHCFFNVIVSCLITLKDIKKPKHFAPKNLQRLYPRSQAELTIALQSLFPL